MKKRMIYIFLFSAITFLLLFFADIFMRNIAGLYSLLFAVTLLHAFILSGINRFKPRKSGDFLKIGLISAAAITAALIIISFIPGLVAYVRRWSLFVSAFFVVSNALCLALAAVLLYLFKKNPLNEK